MLEERTGTTTTDSSLLRLRERTLTRIHQTTARDRSTLMIFENVHGTQAQGFGRMIASSLAQTLREVEFLHSNSILAAMFALKNWSRFNLRNLEQKWMEGKSHNGMIQFLPTSATTCTRYLPSCLRCHDKCCKYRGAVQLLPCSICSLLWLPKVPLDIASSEPRCQPCRS